MDIAKSTYLWGSIVEPHECDYDDTRELGLKCVCCHQPVFLVKGKEFTNSKGTLVKVKPYFAHYKKDSDTDLCEKRIAGSEGQAIREYIQGQVRGQRLSLYRDFFKDMVDWAVVIAIVDENNPKKLKDCRRLIKKVRSFPYDEGLARSIQDLLTLGSTNFKKTIKQDLYRDCIRSSIIYSEIVDLIRSELELCEYLFKIAMAIKEYARVYKPSMYEEIREITGKHKEEYDLSEKKATVFTHTLLGLGILSTIEWYKVVDLWLNRNWRRKQGIKQRGFGK